MWVEALFMNTWCTSHLIRLVKIDDETETFPFQIIAPGISNTFFFFHTARAFTPLILGPAKVSRSKKFLSTNVLQIFCRTGGMLYIPKAAYLSFIHRFDDGIFLVKRTFHLNHGWNVNVWSSLFFARAKNFRIDNVRESWHNWKVSRASSKFLQHDKFYCRSRNLVVSYLLRIKYQYFLIIY